MLFAREVVISTVFGPCREPIPNSAAMHNPVVYPTKPIAAGMKHMHNSTHKRPYVSYLVHLPDQVVDVVFPVAQVTTLNEVLELPFLEAAVGAVQLEWPQEVGGLLEVGADSVNLVDKVFHADHAVLSKVVLDDLVVSQRQALLVNLSVSALCRTS